MWEGAPALEDVAGLAAPDEGFGIAAPDDAFGLAHWDEPVPHGGTPEQVGFGGVMASVCPYRMSAPSTSSLGSSPISPWRRCCATSSAYLN